VLASHGNIALMGLKGNPVRFIRRSSGPHPAVIRRSPGGHPEVNRPRAAGRL
jgi:hypothetical protein